MVDLQKCRTGITSTLFTGNVFVVLGTIISVLFSAAIGGNDSANVIGTSIASGALNMKQGIIIASIFELAGAFFLGGSVSGTISAGIAKTDSFEDPVEFMAGMLTALISTFFWLFAATLWSIPVSTTHSIVGSVIGFTILSHGFGAVYWSKIGTIASSWIISPALGAIIAYILFKLTAKLCFDCKDPIKRTIDLMPGFFAFSMFIFTLFFTTKGLSNVIELSFSTCLYASLITSALSFIVHYIFFRPRMNRDIPQSILDKHRTLLSIDIVRPSIDLSRVSVDLVRPSITTDVELGETKVVSKDRVSIDDTVTSIKPNSTPSIKKRGSIISLNDVIIDGQESKQEQETHQAATDDNITSEVQVEEINPEQHTFDQQLQDQIIAKLRRKSADKLFIPLQILSCCFIATAHGSIDIAKSAGPLAAIMHVWRFGDVGRNADVPLWVLAATGVGMTSGLAILGHKVVGTIGTKITKVTALNGTVIQLAAAATVLLGSSLGLPLSTSHTLVGAVIGQSIARKTAIRWVTVRNIFVAMIVTLPISILTSMLVFKSISFGI
ncbi:hypothetical protein RCL1_000192 [Eukaryota sp. TZLM3-RCL]